MPKRIAITGGTGFLGGHLVRHLGREGYSVRILARSEQKAEPSRGLIEGFEVGEITDQAALERLFTGCDSVVHLVSNFRVASGPKESYHRINVEGTATALRAARAVGVSRFVHCSTIGVHGDVHPSPGNESSAFRPGDLYQETKVLAEEAVRAEVARGGMEIAIVRPCSMYGPGDLRMLKMFRMLAKRRFFVLGPCRENFHAVYIDDLVKGFQRVVEAPGIQGEPFILGGPEYVTLEEYINTAAAAVGAPPPWIRLPYGPILALSAVCEAACVPFGIEPPLHPRRVRFFKNNRAFRIDKARERLGYDPEIGLDEGMRRTVEWYRQQGLLR